MPSKLSFKESIKQLIQQLESRPESIEFSEVMGLIETHYDYHASDFDNGIEPNKVHNSAGTNEGSCKIFAFAQLIGLSKEQTLACFGDYYRDDVVKHPNGTDHQNIRTFILSGWAGIRFYSSPLTLKPL